MPCPSRLTPGISAALGSPEDPGRYSRIFELAVAKLRGGDCGTGVNLGLGYRGHHGHPPWGFLVISGFAVGVEHAGGRERGGWCEAFCARWGGGLRSMFCNELAVIPGPKEALSSGKAVDPVQGPVHA